MIDTWKSGFAEEALHDVLIHAHSRGKHARTYVRNSRELEQSLNGPVFSERPVENGENHVELSGGVGRAPGGIERHKPRPGRVERRGDAPALVEHSGQPVSRGVPRRADQPTAFARDADEHNFIFGRVERRKHRSRGGQRDFVLARAAAKQQPHT